VQGQSALVTDEGRLMAQHPGTAQVLSA